MNSKLFIVMYHYVRRIANSRYPGIKGMELELFRKQLDFFEKYFNVVRMEDVIGAINKVISLPKNAIL